MQPIILLGIIAVGAAALGTGFLAPEIANVWVQNIGVGDADLFTPVNHVAVDLDVAPIINQGPNPTILTDNYFDNKVVECSWHIGIDDLATNDMGTPDDPTDDMTETDIEEVICKITDANDNAIAECSKLYPDTPANEPDYPFSQHQACNEQNGNPLVEAYPGALLIDNVEDVRIVVRGSNPTLPVLFD